MIQFDEHILQMGWNHQLDVHFCLLSHCVQRSRLGDRRWSASCDWNSAGLGMGIWRGFRAPMYAVYVVPGDSIISWNHEIWDVSLYSGMFSHWLWLPFYVWNFNFWWENDCCKSQDMKQSILSRRFISEDKVGFRQCQVGLLHPSLKLLELQVSGWFSWCRRNAGLSR